MRKNKQIMKLSIATYFIFFPLHLTNIQATETKEIEYIDYSDATISPNQQNEINSEETIIFEISIANEETNANLPTEVYSNAKTVSPSTVNSNVLSISFLVGVFTMCAIGLILSYRSKIKKKK